MIRLSLPERLVHCSINLLMGRLIKIRSSSQHLTPRIVWRGLPQGSVLSPLLYSIYTYDLEQSVSCFSHILQYADDLCLYSTGKDIEDISYRLNLALHYLNDWLVEHSLNLSIPKCNIVVFTRKRSIPAPEITCNNQPLSILESVKFLGVTLDSKMTGIPHFHNVVQKCEKNINILRSLSGVWWGSHPYCQKLLYNSIIRSHLDYGSFLLEPCSKEAISRVEKTQAKALRIILGAMKSSPKNAMQVECVDPPLDLRRQYLSDRFIIKANQISCHPLITRLQDLSDLISQPSCKYWTHKDPPRIVQSFRKLPSLNYPMVQFDINPIFKIDYDALIFEPQVLLDFGILKGDPAADLKLNQQLDTDWQAWTPIYTDASKLSEDGPVGSAVWIPNYKILLSYRSPKEASVFTDGA